MDKTGYMFNHGFHPSTTIPIEFGLELVDSSSGKEENFSIKVFKLDLCCNEEKRKVLLNFFHYIDSTNKTIYLCYSNVQVFCGDDKIEVISQKELPLLRRAVYDAIEDTYA